MIGAVVVTFVFAHQLHLEAATIALTGAGVMMLLETLPHHPTATPNS